MAERRKDLEQAPFKKPMFLTDLIAPVEMVNVKIGNYYYNDYTADAAVQTGRTTGTAPTAVNLTATSDTFSCAEDIKRYKIGVSEIELHGGLEYAELRAARLGKRSVYNAIETVTAANVLANGTATVDDIEASLLGAVADGVSSITDIAPNGKVALVCSHKIFNRIKRYTEITAKMAYTGVLPQGIADVRGISEAQLAACLGVDMVLVGPNSIWYDLSATYQDRASLVVLPNGDPLEEVTFASTLVYRVDPSDDNMFTVETYYDDNLKANVCDTTSWNIQKVWNPEALYILDGIDESNSVTTSA